MFVIKLIKFYISFFSIFQTKIKWKNEIYLSINIFGIIVCVRKYQNKWTFRLCVFFFFIEKLHFNLQSAALEAYLFYFARIQRKNYYTCAITDKSTLWFITPWNVNKNCFLRINHAAFQNFRICEGACLLIAFRAWFVGLRAV